MRIIVVSDTHRAQIEAIERIQEMDRPDLILHLGDNVEDGENMARILGIETIIVRGNGDYGDEYPFDRIIEVEGKKIFMTHGHRYNIRWDHMPLYYKGQEVGADIILYGHTHRPVNLREDGILIMNPGSPVLPRQLERIGTMGLIEIKDGEIKSQIIALTS